MNLHGNESYHAAMLQAPQSLFVPVNSVSFPFLMILILENFVNLFSCIKYQGMDKEDNGQDFLQFGLEHLLPNHF